MDQGVCQNAARHVKTRQVRQLTLASLVTGNVLSKQRKQAGKQDTAGFGPNPSLPYHIPRAEAAARKESVFPVLSSVEVGLSVNLDPRQSATL